MGGNEGRSSLSCFGRKANYVARQLAKAARSVNRSANLALAVSMAMHLQQQAELRTHASDVVDIADCGHNAQVEKPESIVDLLERLTG